MGRPSNCGQSRRQNLTKCFSPVVLGQRNLPIFDGNALNRDIIHDVTALVIGFWYAAIVLRIWALCRKQIRRFPFVWIFVAMSAVRSILLVITQIRHDLHSATLVSVYSMPVMLLAEALAIMNVFGALTEKYPNFKRAGSIFLGVLTVAGVGAACLTRFAAVPPGWDGFWQGSALLQRHVMVGMIVVLIGVRALLPKVNGIPVRETADRAADVITCEVAFGLLASTIAIATGHQFKLLDALVPILGSVVTGALWAFWMPRGSERCADFVPMTEEEYGTQAEASARREQELWDALSESRREWTT